MSAPFTDLAFFLVNPNFVKSYLTDLPLNFKQQVAFLRWRCILTLFCSYYLPHPHATSLALPPERVHEAEGMTAASTNC
jgi:hypothetical protein